MQLLKSQRDLYRYINDETLRAINHGETPDEIAEDFKLPDGLAKVWANRGYYGSISHDVKATYVLYMGWFNGKPGDIAPADSGGRQQGVRRVHGRRGCHLDQGKGRLRKGQLPLGR